MAYTDQEIDSIFNEILLGIISGDSLRSILMKKDMPSTQTFYKWIESDENKSKQYARATTIRADVLFDEIIEIADDDSGDRKVNEKTGEEVLDSEFVQRSRLKVDARKWAISKMNPKKYGDKLDIDHTTKGEKINKADLTKLTDEELTILIELQSKSGTSET
jgi:hypothetical protein